MKFDILYLVAHKPKQYEGDKNTMNEIITLDQLPIIGNEEKIKQISLEIDKVVEPALSIECTEESKQDVKKLRTALTKRFDEYEQQRKQVKTAILAPYEAFEKLYKENIADKFKNADKLLYDKVNAIESVQITSKKNNVIEYFNEYLQSLNIDFIKFEDLNVKINLSTTEKKIKEEIKAKLDTVKADLVAIAGDDELLIEYQKCLRLPVAMQTVQERRSKLEELKNKPVETPVAVAPVIQAPIVEPLAHPAPLVEVVPEKIYTVKFQVTGEVSKLKALKEFLINNQIEYINL